MTMIISDSGVQFATGNIIQVATAMPTTSTWTAGDLVLQPNTTSGLTGWKRITTGSNNVLGTDWIVYGLSQGVVQNTTSGTAIDFTGIPSWAKRITVMLNGVSTNGANLILLQLGNGSIVITGYLDFVVNSQGGSGITTKTTTGFAGDGGSAVFLYYGTFTLNLQTGNTWVCSKSLGADNGGIARTATGGGSITLGSSLDRVRLTTVGATDTFDAGSVNILYE